MKTALMLIIAALTCAGCQSRSDIMESYDLRIPDHGEVLPRAFRDGWKQAGRLATEAELAGCIKGNGTHGHYSPTLDKIVVPADGCALSTLRHEQDHLKLWHAGVRDRAALEKSAMEIEIRCLVYEQGWTIAQVRGLSKLNAAVLDSTYERILK